MVTPVLFKRYPTPYDLAKADPKDVETIIQSTGFFRSKTASIIGTARKLVSDFNGEVPDTMKQLTSLPGVARKTANVVLGVAYKKPVGVVVDTHVKRISQRLGFTKNTTPEKIEKDLMALLPQEEWIQFSHLLIAHGRALCIARYPQCQLCPIEMSCTYQRITPRKLSSSRSKKST